MRKNQSCVTWILRCKSAIEILDIHAGIFQIFEPGLTHFQVIQPTRSQLEPIRSEPVLSRRRRGGGGCSVIQ